MFEEVKSVIIDVLGVSEDEVTPEASLTDDLGADSLDAVEIGNSIEIALIEKYPGIKIRRCTLSPIIGAHTGPGMAAICHLGK